MNKKVISSGVWFTISNFIVRSIGFITTPIFTRMLTKAEFGDYSNFAAWASLALVVTSLNLEASLIRARFDHEKHLNDYAFSIIVLSAVSTVCWYLVFNCFSSYFSSWLAIDEKYIHCMFAYLIFYPAVNIFQTMERFQYKYKWTVLVSLSIAVSTALLSVLLVIILPNGLTGRVLGFVIPAAIAGLAIYLFYVRHRSRVDIVYWKYALPFTLPFIPHLLAMNLLSNMDRIMIKRFCGANDLALYSLAYTCGTIISILVTSINSAYSPWLGEMLSKGNYGRINKISIPYVSFFVYCAIGATLVIPEVLYLLGGTNYMEAMYVMPPVAASTILQFIYCMYVNVEQYEKRTQMMAVASVLSVLCNYGLNYYFIPIYGYIAAAYTTYASYFILMVLHMMIVRKIGRHIVYPNFIIVGIAVISSAVMFCTTYVMDKPIIRYMIVCFYGIAGASVAIKNKELILQFIKKKKV